MKNTAVKKIGHKMVNAGRVDKSVEKKDNNIKTKLGDNISFIPDDIRKKQTNVHFPVKTSAVTAKIALEKKLENEGELEKELTSPVSDTIEQIKMIASSKENESLKKVFDKKPGLKIAAAGVLGLLVGYLIGRKTT